MDSQEISTIKAWEKFLDPQKLRRSLIEASVFIAAYEVLKELIVGRTKSFLALGREDEPENRAEYEREMKALHKKAFTASCLWLQNQGAITSQDVELIGKIT